MNIFLLMFQILDILRNFGKKIRVSEALVWKLFLLL